MLLVIEICGNGFQAGELGPGTIVGSAAYNLFIIPAVCILAVPSIYQISLQCFVPSLELMLLIILMENLNFSNIFDNSLDFFRKTFLAKNKKLRNMHLSQGQGQSSQS